MIEVIKLYPVCNSRNQSVYNAVHLTRGPLLFDFVSGPLLITIVFFKCHDKIFRFHDKLLILHSNVLVVYVFKPDKQLKLFIRLAYTMVIGTAIQVYSTSTREGATLTISFCDGPLILQFFLYNTFICYFDRAKTPTSSISGR